MVRKLRSLTAFVIALTLLLSFTTIAFAASTDLTYKEYLAMSTEEQIAFRNQFSSSSEFKKWYLAAKQAYEDSQNKVVIGDGNSVDLGEILNPSVSSGNCGTDLTWTLSKNGVLTISGTGAIFDYTTDNAPWAGNASGIYKVELPQGLTSVGKNAFSSCTSITDVYYAGTEYNWSAVAISTGNDSLTSAMMHYRSAVLTGISVKTIPTKTVYNIGDEIDATGLVITLLYNDGSQTDITSGFTLSQLDSTSAGTKTITVSYSNQTTSFNVSVVTTPAKIEILTPPDKTEYWVGETFDATGLALNVTYTDGSVLPIYSSYEVTEFDSSISGEKTVVITYQNLTTTLTVCVNEVTLSDIEIITPPSKTTYWVGEVLDPTGLTVKCHYSNGTADEITTGYEISGFDSSVEGTITVTLTYLGCSETFEIIISNDGRCGEYLSWNIDENGILTITGSGAMYDYTYGTAPWFNETISAVSLDPAITYIGTYAFTDLDCLTTIEISDTVTIGYGAFAHCQNLKSISVSANHPNYSIDAQGALYSKDKSVLIQVPGAFAGKFNVPVSVTEIGESAFSGCRNLTEVHFSGSSGATGGFIERDSFIAGTNSNTVAFGVCNVAAIGCSAFADCVKLTAITIPAKVTTINDGTFQNCIRLAKITLPKNISTIGKGAFNGCTALNHIVFAGSKAEWTDNSIGENNAPLTSTPILFSREIKLTNAAPTLYDNIAMNYKVNKPLFDEMGITNLYLKVSFNGQETTITDYTVSEDGKQYIFTFYNIAPNQMDDNMAATLYATYGGDTYKGATLNFSVATYCYGMMNNSTVANHPDYAELRTLLVDLLNYGAAAQAFTGYTGEKVNARLTATQASWGNTEPLTLENKTMTRYATVESPTASWKSLALILQDAVTMRFKFTAPTLENVTVKVTSDSNPEGWIIGTGAIQYEESSGRYYVDFSGLHAGQMRECVYVTVYQGDSPISNTARFSVESYAAQYQNADPVLYPGFADLCKAMMRYGDAAYNFAN